MLCNVNLGQSRHFAGLESSVYKPASVANQKRCKKSHHTPALIRLFEQLHQLFPFYWFCPFIRLILTAINYLVILIRKKHLFNQMNY